MQAQAITPNRTKTNLLVDLTIFGAFLLTTAPRFTGSAIHEWLGISFGAAILILAALVVVGATVAFASTDYASSLVSAVGGRVEKGGPVFGENLSMNETGDAPSGAVIDSQTQGANRAPRGEAEGSAVLNATDRVKNALTLSLMVAAVGFVTWLWDRMKPKRRALVG